VLQDSELVTLLFTLAALAVLPVIARGLTLPGLRLFVAGFVSVACGGVCAVAATSRFRETVALLEHVFDAAAGVSFLAALVVLWRAQRHHEGTR
jgi:hypothetical protein